MIEVEGMKLVGVGVVLGVMMVLCLWFTGRQVSAEWHLKKGQTFRAEQEVAKMLEHYEKATMAMPWMYVYWNAYGEGAFDFGTYDQVDIEILEALLEKSISGYENAYRLVNTQPYIPANLGLAYLAYSEVLEAKGAKIQAQSAREEGMNRYEEAVEVAVNNPRFVSTWAKLLLSVGREEEAREALLQVLAIRKPYQDTYYQLALLATNRKNYDEAREYIQKALQQMPGDEKVKALLQRIHEETK
ncbi:MAG: hypothetical protein UW70_C0013G0016 [Candidatus Peregrinibacteria bacterium GW2011_GWA2_44_7]|nr:MAG: hypothetical protein UW70_C0013G0016 [Candidatus Peregrinibacteria bacterium GW2011_GWA2_44_7]